jgi:UDP-N-acetylmuramate--alanine ligase
MVVHILRSCGLDPAYAVGGELSSTGRNADWGGGEWIVIEADESDRSLLNYTPEIAILTNSELDHHATYSSRLDLDATFEEFLGRARVAVVWDRPELTALAAGAGELIPYDAREPVLTPAGARFRWRDFEVTLAVPGLHNAVNAAGALSASLAAGAEPQAAVAAIASFDGARRRMQRLGRSGAGAQVYDDYAHHPMKVRAALSAALTLDPRRLVVVFQPHLFSRTRALADDFGRALALADICCVVGIYPARERAEDFPGVDGHLVAAAVADARAGVQVAWMPSLDDAHRWLDTVLRDGDLCLVMGAGNVDSLGRALVTDEA